MNLSEYELSKWNDVRVNLNSVKRFVDNTILLKGELLKNFLYNPLDEIKEGDMVLSRVSNGGVVVRKGEIFYHLLDDGRFYIISHLWNWTMYLGENNDLKKFIRHVYFEVSRTGNNWLNE